jgi:hypothetical protein
MNLEPDTESLQYPTNYPRQVPRELQLKRSELCALLERHITEMLLALDYLPEYDADGNYQEPWRGFVKMQLEQLRTFIWE